MQRFTLRSQNAVLSDFQSGLRSAFFPSLQTSLFYHYTSWLPATFETYQF